jgi:hypothetical protein
MAGHISATLYQAKQVLAMVFHGHMHGIAY